MSLKLQASVPPEPLYLTTRQVAERLQVSVSTVRRMANEGVLKEARIGHRTCRYRVEDVDAALAPTASADLPQKDQVDDAVQRALATIRAPSPTRKPG